MSSIPWASYFRADHLILHRLASYFNVYHITLHSSIPLASYFCGIHPLGKLFSCQPFNSPAFGELFSCRSYNSPPIHPFGELFLCRPSLGRAIFMPTISFSILWRIIFVLSNPGSSYFRAYYLILHPLASYFCADHLTLHPSIPLASYFCPVQPLGELLSCLLFDSSYFCELFSC